MSHLSTGWQYDHGLNNVRAMVKKCLLLPETVLDQIDKISKSNGVVMYQAFMWCLFKVSLRAEIWPISDGYEECKS